MRKRQVNVPLARNNDLPHGFLHPPILSWECFALSPLFFLALGSPVCRIGFQSHRMFAGKGACGLLFQATLSDPIDQAGAR